MRRLLGSVLPALALTGLLAGCGDDSGPVTSDPGPTASSSTTKGSPTGAEVDFDLVRTFTSTGAGGVVSDVAVPLGDDTAVQEFTAQFDADTMATNIQDAVDQTDVPDDELLYGAVVAVGCDTPEALSVTSADVGLVITAHQVPSPKPECFAPMTTVALVLVAASAVS